MAENGRVHPQCVHAANPYHECGVACLEKIAQGVVRKEKKKGSFGSSLSFGRKKKGSESRPNSKNDYDSAVKAVYSANALSPRSPFSNGKKMESDNSQSFSCSQQHSDDSYSGHNSFINGRNRSSESVRTPGSESQSDGPKSPSKISLAVFGVPSPTEQEDEEEEEEEEEEEPQLRNSPPHAVSGPLTKNMGGVASDQAVKSMNFTFSGISTEASDEEDVRSVFSDSCVLVGKYHVRANVASLLEMIMEKYGDIAADCRLESASLRGFYLECLCSVVQELQTTPFESLTKSKIMEMLAVLKDVESANINVTWLRGILNELTEAMDIKTTEAAKFNCDNAIASTKEELETLLQNLADKEKAVAEANEQIAETRRRLSELELEASRLSNAISSIQPKIEKFRLKPLSQEIF